MRVTEYINFYNCKRPHKTLKYKTPEPAEQEIFRCCKGLSLITFGVRWFKSQELLLFGAVFSDLEEVILDTGICEEPRNP